MKMEEEIVTWNLKGPKRMRKRRELNALVKNNQKYKSLFKDNSAIDMFNMNSGASRLLKSNDSSTDNEDYYFSANKSIIREKRRKNCCKLLQMTMLGFFVTFILIVGVLLMFSYSKFNETLNDLKVEFQSQNVQNKMNVDEIKRQLNRYDSLFKKDIADADTNSNDNVHDTANKITKSKRSIALTNKSNSNLIDWIYNKSKLFGRNDKSKALAKDELTKLFTNYHDKNEDEFNVKYYKNFVDNFFKRKNQFSNVNSSFLTNQSISSIRAQIMNEVESLYIKPILESLTNCNCQPASPYLLIKNETISNIQTN